MNKYFAICPRGLEVLLSDSWPQWGDRVFNVTHGGVHFAGDWSVCYRANLSLVWRRESCAMSSNHPTGMKMIFTI